MKNLFPEVQHRKKGLHIEISEAHAYNETMDWNLEICEREWQRISKHLPEIEVQNEVDKETIDNPLGVSITEQYNHGEDSSIPPKKKLKQNEMEQTIDELTVLEQYVKGKMNCWRSLMLGVKQS